MTVAVMQKAGTGVRKQPRQRRQSRVMMTVAMMKKAGIGLRSNFKRLTTVQVDDDSSSDKESWDRS